MNHTPVIACGRGEMSCEVRSWLPSAVAATLRADRSAQPVIDWLHAIRDSIEEYDPLVTVRPVSPVSTDSGGSSAFDDILSHLGKEIYKLDEYQRNLVPAEEVSLSILNIFDECLQGMESSDMDAAKSEVCSDGETVTGASPTPEADSLVSSAPIPMPRARSVVSCTDSDSESTCWSYKDCGTVVTPGQRYAAVWSHSSGFHNSDEILRRVLTQHHAVCRLDYETVGEFASAHYGVYSLDRCESVDGMTPDAPDDGYEPVRGTDENIYEEIEYGCYTDEGCSCGGSVVESCSVSASSEGVGRESPLYANLRDHDAYAVPPDVIYWKNLLADPFYNEDEEDEVSESNLA